MKKKHDVFYGFTALLIAVIFTLAGCGPKETPAANFEFTDVTGTITGYNGKIKDVVIPAKINGKQVTSIYSNAFVNKGLTSVVIPKGVTSIQAAAFAVNELTSVAIPDSVTEIGESAFKSNELTSVTIPNGVVKIGSGAFQDNKRLTSVSIPNSVTEIWASAFSNTALTSVTIPDSVTEISGSVFEGAKQLTSVTIPDSVTIIWHRAFWGTKLTSITIGNNVTLEISELNSVSEYDPFGWGIRSDQNYSDTGFGAFYSENGKKAGTYTRENADSNQWSYTAR